jgi:hypothetical protein
MTEPLVSITDYLLAGETAFLTMLLHARPRSGPLRPWLLALFGSLCAASFAGGTVHGFFLDEASVGHAVLWPATLIAIGLTALSLLALAVRLALAPRAARRVMRTGAILFAVYSAAVLLLHVGFIAAIAVYLPAMLYFLWVLTTQWRRTHNVGTACGILSVLLTLLASGIQQSGLVLPGLAGANNILYHVIEAIAFVYLFRAALWIDTQHSLPLR